MKDKNDSTHRRSDSENTIDMYKKDKNEKHDKHDKHDKHEKHHHVLDHSTTSSPTLLNHEHIEEKKKKSSLPFFFRKKDRDRSDSTRSSESEDEKKSKKSLEYQKSNQGRSSSFGGNEGRKFLPVRGLDDDSSMNQALLNVDEHSSIHQQGARKESGWEAPASWRVMTSPEKEVINVRQSISEESDKQENENSKGRWVPPSSWNTPKDMRDIADWNIRVTKRDHTFATITCSLDTTVAELRILLNKKFFIKKDDSYQFYLRKNGMEWHLDPDERPIYMEKHFFESLGYTDIDEMEQQGRKDHGYLFSFIYSDQPPNYGKPPRGIDGDYRTVNVAGLNLEALPLSVFKRANQIENLNMSRNPRVDFHLDFAELCTSLVSLKLSENEYLKVPKSTTLIITLQKLDLSRNYFDVVPPAIGKLVNLTEFDLKCNYLSALPREMENMTNLTTLNLSNNLFEVCPFVIFSLVNLRNLDFSFCRLSSLQPQIEKLVKLTVLRLRGNQLTSLPSSISTLPLVELDIRENKIPDLTSIEKMGTIKKIFSENNVVTTFAIGEKHGPMLNLFLSNNSITRFDVVCPTSNISVLSLSKNKLLEFPDAFNKLPNLEQLDLDSNHISSLPSSITSLKKLKSLTVADNDLTTLPEDIGKLSKLEYLNVRNNNMKSLPREIWKLNSLVVFNASSNLLERFPDFPQGEGVAKGEQAQLFDSLYELYLGDNNLGSGDPFPMITQFVELRILNLNYNFIVEVPASIKKLSKLLKLYLVGNILSSIPDEIGDLRDLRQLFLSSNKLVTLPSEMSKLTHLSIVDISYNNLKYNISNVQYEWDWNKNKELKVLDMSGNQKLQFNTKPGSEEENFQLPKLQVLCVNDMAEVPISEKLEKQVICRRSHEELNSGVADFLGQDTLLMTRDMEKIFEDYRIYALFEGRNGASISGYLHRWLLYKLSVELKQVQSHKDCLRRTFLSLNKDMGLSNVADGDGEQAGCTAVIALLRDRKLTVANVGDTQAIICRNGKAVLTTQKHSTIDKEEVQRIKRAGGFIAPNGKLNGSVDYTRAFGNFSLLPAVNACPYVNEIDLQQDDEFLIIAGSPFWEHVGYQTAIDIARQEVSSPLRAAHRLRDFAITYGVSNAFSVMVIPLSTAAASTVAKTRVQKREVTDSTLARLEAEIDPPTGKISLVFTDIKNSTLLWETNPHAMRAAIKVHNAIMRRNLRNIGGYEVKTEGDAFMVSFKNAEDALKWCLAIQLELLEADWPQEILESPDGRETRGEDGKLLFRGLSIRMGIHVGEPVCEKDPVTGRMDYFGPPVNRAARVSSTADGGQVVLSEEAYSDLHQKFPQFQATFEPIVYDMGNIHLKGLGAERIFMIIPTNLNGRVFYYKNLPSLQGIKAQDVKTEQLVRKSYIPKETFEDLEKVCIRLEKLAGLSHPPFTIPKPEAPSEEHLRSLETLITRIESATSSLYMFKVGLYTEKIQKLFSTGSGNTPHFRKEDPTSLLRALEYVLKASGAADLPL